MATARDWLKIKAEYIAGGISMRELSGKYKVPESTIRKKASKEKWKADRNKSTQKTEQKIQGKLIENRSEKIMKGIDVTRYAADLWADNLKTLLTLIRQTPEYMITSPQFVSGISNGLKSTWETLLDMSGLSAQQKKLELEREKLQLEREKFAAEQEAQRKAAAAGGSMTTWRIIEDGEEEEQT